MYCPKCKTEYREGFATCVDCDVTLVVELPQQSAEPEEGQLVPADWQYLLTASDGMEASFIASFLDGEEIPVFKKLTGSDAYLQVFMGANMGTAIGGVQIFVPKDCLEQAKEIIEAYQETELPGTIDDDDFEDYNDIEFDNNGVEDNYESRKVVSRTFIIWLCIVPALIGIFIALFRLPLLFLRL